MVVHQQASLPRDGPGASALGQRDYLGQVLVGRLARTPQSALCAAEAKLRLKKDKASLLREDDTRIQARSDDLPSGEPCRDPEPAGFNPQNARTSSRTRPGALRLLQDRQAQGLIALGQRELHLLQKGRAQGPIHLRSPIHLLDHLEQVLVSFLKRPFKSIDLACTIVKQRRSACGRLFGEQRELTSRFLGATKKQKETDPGVSLERRHARPHGHLIDTREEALGPAQAPGLHEDPGELHKPHRDQDRGAVGLGVGARLHLE